MKRRAFLLQGSVLTTGYAFRKLLPPFENIEFISGTNFSEKELYKLFKDPPVIYRPFVRWWWNGDRIQPHELARELRLMKEAGIGGVEINPVKFPERTSDMGKKAIPWLSTEWIELLHFAFAQARSLGMTCDLIVGSGWPFGAEYLEGEERSQVMVIGTKKLEGPRDYEVSLFELFKEADPPISSPYSGRQMEMMSVHLVPLMLNNMNEVKDLSDQIAAGNVRCKIPEGKYVLYALVKISGFMEVINGAPGATGPVLNHYNEQAVKKYLNRMSDAIQQKIGPLSGYIRALFSDSLELEGANWCADMAEQFMQRRGYNLLPWLPFLLFRTGNMGNTFDYNYGAEYGDEFKDMIQRVRYDFDLTKTELITERFIKPFTDWCKENNVLSRAQAYGRGYFLLEGSFDIDIPECETWIKYGLGTEMSESDYRVGRAYTMINKYVSSAAHLKGKRLISCEELTNTDMVFNETLETLKLAGDQSIISGVTHSVFHGFNYSPPEAPMPGWIRYGTFINERNPWWPWFRCFTDYKARLSALLQQAEMFADIALLPPTEDMWSIYGAQNEPFPALIHPTYQTLIWEAIHHNGNGCDYISQQVIRDATIKDGCLYYGPRKYHTIFLIDVQSLEPVIAQKLFDFITSGGRIFCIEAAPAKAPGWYNHEARDKEVQKWVSEMRNYNDRFIILEKPRDDFIEWYRGVQQKYKIAPYVYINRPNAFITQVRYKTGSTEILLFINSSITHSYDLTISPEPGIISGKEPWIWDAEDAERYHLEMTGGRIKLQMGPADLKLLVFDMQKNAVFRKPPVTEEGQVVELVGTWSVEFQHIDGSINKKEINELKDIKDMAEFVNFCGTAIYRINLLVTDKSKVTWIKLGRVFGISELHINGQDAGSRWYGKRIYSIGQFIRTGNNSIEIRIVTVMGNYLKSLAENPIAQYWTNEKRKNQPIQSMGLLGPVTLY